MRRLRDIVIHARERAAPPRAASKRGRARRRPARPWVRPVAVLAAVLLPVAGAVLFARSDLAARQYAQARAGAIAYAGQAGFRVQQIYVQGRQRTPRQDLLTALAIGQGDPIFGLDLVATRRRLEEIPWVKTVVLERRLPDELHIVITERAPIAIWQNRGHYYLVDGDGLVVGDEIADFPHLPLIVGEGAPDHAAELVALLAEEPELAKRVKAAQWISERRWNLSFDRSPGGIDVRLPEEEPVKAYHDLADLERNHKILERKITLIDMRLPDRLVLRGTGGAEESAAAAHARRKPANGRDT